MGTIATRALVAATLLLCGGSWAQSVYRCETQGRISYSHEPCIGAKVVDTTPTQGLDRSSGVSRKGADVGREERRKGMHDALRPLTGRSHEEMKVVERRRQLPAKAQLECQWLDVQLPMQERTASSATAKDRESLETRLFLSRSQYRNLGC